MVYESQVVCSCGTVSKCYAIIVVKAAISTQEAFCELVTSVSCTQTVELTNVLLTQRSATLLFITVRCHKIYSYAKRKLNLLKMESDPLSNFIH